MVFQVEDFFLKHLLAMEVCDGLSFKLFGLVIIQMIIKLCVFSFIRNLDQFMILKVSQFNMKIFVFLY